MVRRKMPLGDWLFLHLVILPAYLVVGFVIGWGLLQLFALLPRPTP